MYETVSSGSIYNNCHNTLSFTIQVHFKAFCIDFKYHSHPILNSHDFKVYHNNTKRTINVASALTS